MTWQHGGCKSAQRNGTNISPSGDNLLFFRAVAAALRVLTLAFFRAFLVLLFTLPPGVLLASGLVHAAGSAEATGTECPIQGELMHWIADWCMLTLGTDDEIAAGDCIARELEVASKDACKAKLQFKSAMCGVVIARDGSGTVERCVADRGFAGGTVRNGGVGGRRGSADIPRPAGTMRH